MTDTRVRKTKRADELEPGDWIAAGRYNQNRIDGTDDAKVLFIQRHGETMVSLMIQEHTVPQPELIHLGSAFEVPLLSDHEVAALQADAERAERIADIRAFADYLEQNPWMRLPASVHAQTHGLSGADGVAEVRRLAEQAGTKVDDHLGDRTDFDLKFGDVGFTVIAWHPDGRPVEQEPQVVHPSWPTEGALKPWESLAPMADRVAESIGLDYSREADDPTPVSPARVPLHTGAMVDGDHLVDETPAEMVTVYFSFGHGQTDPDTGENLLDKYVTVIGPSHDACRAAMFSSRYSNNWAFDYPAGSRDTDKWIPRWTEHDRIVVDAEPPKCYVPNGFWAPEVNAELQRQCAAQHPGTPCRSAAE